ncbi:MAG: excinuclease ABC subunit UvrC [Clostridia bacterium]|nr:excinuclease ABC subunit UvrC [Clostridia bacterium]MBQ1994816.1 excinuclease ABC subunit UvrC [Clostridia bacterium]
MAENLKLRELREKAMKLPLTPGVYIMKNKDKKIIYIGKAKKLKNRVSTYFGSQNNHSTKVRKMVENVDDFDYILTDSEFEALVLECSLIKQNMPKYNILLKDDKGYSYIKITKGPWGKISASFRKDDPTATYLGPYTGNFSVKNSVDEAREIFKLPSCQKVFPRDIGKGRPCLNYFISKCSAPCARKISLEEYEENLSQAVEFLKGGSAETIKRLKAEMEEAAENLEFEKAAKIRDKIKSIEKIGSKQKVVVGGSTNEDVFAIAQGEEKACLAVLSFREGLLISTEHFIIDYSENLPDTRQELITSFYSMERQIPPLVVVDGEVTDAELISDWLTEKRGKKAQVFLPQRGEKARVTEMCLSNAAQKLGEYLGRKGNETAALDELSKLLGLSKSPEYIESYDISHTAGSDNVAGMVVFKNGKPFKSAYRKFSIKGFDGQDDYGSMKEVISRRLNRYEEEKENGEGFGKLPDLILLDGGQGQVNAVKPIIEAFGYDIPVFGMVKDNKHRTRAIADGGEEIAINSSRRAFTLVSSIQEEVHRFAISYHKKKHSKSSLVLSLTKIEGIGEKKASILLKEMKTLTAIKNASAETLSAIKGISKNDGEAVFRYFHSEQ